MGGRNAKRQLKRVRRDTEEYQVVVRQLMNICSINGRTVSFPYELPIILQELFDASSSNEEIHTERSQQKKRLALDRLSEHADISGYIDMESFIEKPGQEFSEFQSQSTEIQPPPPISKGQESMPMSMEDMKAKMEAGQNRMFDRIEKKGVKYKFGSGPATGQKMSRADVPGQKRPQQQEREPSFSSDFSDLLEEDELGGMDTNWTDQKPASRTKGPVNPVTGVAIEDARELIAKITGRKPAAPGGNPTPKPVT